MPTRGQASNFVFWCPEIFPDRIEISWEFRPIREPGLCILFFAAAGIGGKDLFDPSLPRRTGEYEQYHSGSIEALHVSCFRRRYPEERAFSPLQSSQEQGIPSGGPGGRSPAGRGRRAHAVPHRDPQERPAGEVLYQRARSLRMA
jgi:hypothetical protein